MPIPLRDVLNHPSLAPAGPVLITGRENPLVRWVHSSEVMELAHLLRGGELVLTAGLVLAGATESQQRRYVRELVARQVAAVAIETDGPIPEPVLDEARRLDFSLICLTRTIPFVAITESINGQLINESVSRLRLADSLSDELSQRLTEGGDVHTLVDVLAARLHAGVAVVGCSGDLLAESAGLPAYADDPREAPIAVRNVVTATLLVSSGEQTDPAMLAAALDRAPQSLALSLLRSRPSDADSHATRAFFDALERRAPLPLTQLIASTRLAGTTCFTAVVLPAAARIGTVEQAARRRGRQVLSHLARDELLSVVALDAEHPEKARRALIADLREAGQHPERVAVGPVARDVERIPHSVAEARRCLELSAVGPEAVIDAASVAVDRLVSRLGAKDTLRDFVEEQLGPLLDQEPVTRDRLLDTLVAFFDCAANKTATAQALHLQRQTLYQRLDRISEHLDRDITAPTSAPALHMAIRLWQAMTSDGSWPVPAK